MRAVVFTKPDYFELIDVPDPASGVDLVTVAVRATDVKILHGTVPFVAFPHIPGHEFGGEIVEVPMPRDCGLEIWSAWKCIYAVANASFLEGFYNLYVN